jgi:plastocyanin
MTNKNIIITVVVVIVVILGAKFLFSKKTADSPITNTGLPDQTQNLETQTTAGAGTNTTKPKVVTPAPAPAPTVTVTYSDSGFSPNPIIIKVGDTVKFVNQSSGKMWVASNPHPIHTDYPGFDERTAVSNGGSYQFTFYRLGRFEYHNHMSPVYVGVIRVE